MNGHDFTLEQNTEARMMLAVARRGLAGAINDAENGIGHLSCDDPKIMEQVRAHWRRLYDTYMNADALLSDLESCARHLTDGDKWEPNPISTWTRRGPTGMTTCATSVVRPCSASWPTCCRRSAT